MESPIAFYRAAFLAVLPRYTGLGHKAAITSADELARLATVHVFGEGAIERQEERLRQDRERHEAYKQSALEQQQAREHADVSALMAAERQRAHDELVARTVQRYSGGSGEGDSGAIVSDGVSEWSAGEEYRA